MAMMQFNESINKHAGFTLVELITVIVILGVISSIGASFMVHAIESYDTAETRNKLIQRGRLTLEQMAREIRMSVPNSQRVSTSNQCLEFVPIVAATRYVSNIATVENNANTKDFLRTASFTLGLGSAKHVLISPYSPAEVYNTGNPGVVAAIASVGSEPITRVDLLSAHRFLRASNALRLFVADDPVRFCLAGSTLQRISQYGYSTSPLTDASPAGTIDIMGHGVSSASGAFSLSPGSVDRHALVVINLTFQQDSISLDLNHQVLIRNGP